MATLPQFPMTKQGVVGWRRNCALVADALSHEPGMDPTRLAKGLTLAQADRVTLLHPHGATEDGEDYATVQSGKALYTISDSGQCVCKDFTSQFNVPCKHVLALQIHEGALTAALELPGSQGEEPAAETPGASPIAPALVRTVDNPAGANFKARVGNMELWYTWHGETDEEVMRRMRESLPVLQELVMACEERQKERETVAREAARLARAADAEVSAALVIDPRVQEMVATAVTRALQGKSLPASTRNGTRPPLDGNDTDPSWCEHHSVSMDYHPANDRGPAWYSHRLGTGGYCKGSN